MNYEEFVADLPLDRTIRFSSAEENEEFMRAYGVEQEVRQLGRGEFQCDMIARSSEQADLYSDRFNRAVSVRLEPPTGMLGFLFPRSVSGQFMACGTNVSDKLIIFPHGTDLDIVAPALLGTEAITISSAKFTEMSEVICPLAARPIGVTIIKENAGELHKLRQRILDLVTRPEPGPDPEELSNLLTEAVAFFGDSSTNREVADPILTDRKRIARLAQEFIHEHYSQVLHLEDLCRVTNVGVRTLQRCFKLYFAMSITDYLKSIRLNAVFRDLHSAHPSQHTVAEIALRNGFSHLGRFSVLFHDRFDELPRETLRR
jgi:AraC-like DNA-binding protein